MFSVAAAKGREHQGGRENHNYHLSVKREVELVGITDL